jgi:hypothetical protein
LTMESCKSDGALAERFHKGKTVVGLLREGSTPFTVPESELSIPPLRQRSLVEFWRLHLRAFPPSDPFKVKVLARTKPRVLQS